MPQILWRTSAPWEGFVPMERALDDLGEGAGKDADGAVADTVGQQEEGASGQGLSRRSRRLRRRRQSGRWRGRLRWRESGW